MEQFIKVTDRQKVEIYILKVEIYTQNSDFLSSLSELKRRYFAQLQSNLVILQIFFTKMAITQPKKVQIPKFWCLKSSTNIWPSFRNIHSVLKDSKI